MAKHTNHSTQIEIGFTPASLYPPDNPAAPLPS